MTTSQAFTCKMRLMPKNKQSSIRVTTMEAELDFSVKDCTTGKRLFDQVTRTIGLREIWFFGLSYFNSQDEETWLNLNKKVSSIDIKKTTPLLFEFRAKFYPEDAKKELIQDTTRRLFFLQVKEDILKNKLYCPPETAVLLASYACQAKYGDYDNHRMNTSTIPLDRLIPNGITGQHDLQRDDWFEMMVRWYKEHKGMDSQTAILSYLEIAQDLEAYGVEFFEIQNKRQTKLILGIDATGLVVYKPPDRNCARVGFPWSEIRNIAFTDKRFTIKPVDKKSPEFVFFTNNLRSNKRIMALCVGNNELYVRRRQPPSIEEQQMRNEALKNSSDKQIERKRLEKEVYARELAEQKVRDLEARLQLASEMLKEAENGPRLPNPLPEVFVSETMPFESDIISREDGRESDPTSPTHLISLRSVISPIVSSQCTHETLKERDGEDCVVPLNQPRTIVSSQLTHNMIKTSNHESPLMFPNQLTSVRSLVSPQHFNEIVKQQDVLPDISSLHAHEMMEEDDKVTVARVDEVIQSVHFVDLAEDRERWSAVDNSIFSLPADTSTCSPPVVIDEQSFRESSLPSITSRPISGDNGAPLKTWVAPSEEETFLDELQGRPLSPTLSDTLPKHYSYTISPIKKCLDDSLLVSNSAGQQILHCAFELDEGKSLPFDTPASSVFPVCVPKLNQPMVGDNYITCLALPQPLENNASSARSGIHIALSSASSSTIDSTISVRQNQSKTLISNSLHLTNKSSQPHKEEKSKKTVVKPISPDAYSKLCGSCKPRCSQARSCSPKVAMPDKAYKACQERLLAESRRMKLSRCEAEQIRARECEKIANKDKRPPFDIYRQPPEDTGFEVNGWNATAKNKQTANSNSAVNMAMTVTPDSSFECDEHSLATLSSLISQNVDFPPTLVSSLRSEELRQSTVKKDTNLQAKLAQLRDRLRTKQKLFPSSTSETIRDYDSNTGAGDKFDTLRQIRRGNTKRRIDEFEAL